MIGYIENIEEATLKNENFRQVLFTGKHCQLVVMSLLPGEEIGEEVHKNVDQFFRVEHGSTKVILGDEEYMVEDNYALIVPAGTKHNIINTSEREPLKLYTIYSPPNHPDGTVHKTIQEAIEYEKNHHN